MMRGFTPLSICCRDAPGAKEVGLHDIHGERVELRRDHTGQFRFSVRHARLEQQLLSIVEAHSG
jgi:hypothetical protein